MGIHHSKVTGHIFTFIPDTVNAPDTEFTIAATMLSDWAREQEIEIVTIDCTEEQAEKFVENNGIEQHRLQAIADNPERIKEPVVLINMGDGTHTLVDGSHRYVIAAMAGWTAIRARLIPFGDWQRFIVTGLPKVGKDRIHSFFSGIV